MAVAGCSVARVSGSRAAKQVGFDVAVHAADADGLELSAVGPISLDARYDQSRVEGGSEVTASIVVHRSGLTGRLLATATSALLGAGALDLAAGRIARAAEASARLAFA